MIVTSRRSNAPRLNNGINHRLLNTPRLKLTTRIPTTSKIQITHNKPSNNQNPNKLKVTQRVPKASTSQTLIKAQSAQPGIKGHISQGPITLNHPPRFPMAIRKAKGRHLFTFERLCSQPE